MKTITLSKQIVLLIAVFALIGTATAQRTREPRNQQQQVQQQPQVQQQQQVQQPDAQAQPNAPLQQQAIGQAAAPNSLCANRPLCYDSNDYVVTVTEFRTSTDGRGSKILDAMLHFVNKTNQPISLGYVDQSGAAIDDMGNRYVLNTYGGGVRGMGIVAGNNMDPKFSLPGGGSGDVRLEFWWAPYGKLAGVNYEIEFSIREMNRVEGNQWTLGDEALIHYQGLANGVGVAPISGGNSFASGSSGFGNNGMAGSTPATGGGVVSSVGSAVNTYVPGQANNTGQVAAQTTYVAAGQPCPPGTTPSTSKAANIANAVGQQNQTANNAISNASSAISSFGSIFGRKKAQANNAAPAGTTPCVATTNTASPMASPVANPTANPVNAAGNPATNAAGNPAAKAALSRTTNTATVPANARGVNAIQPRTVNASVPATATQRTAVNPAVRTITQQPSRVVNNAALRQPANAATAAKPSPAKTAATKTPATTTTNAQGK